MTNRTSRISYTTSGSRWTTPTMRPFGACLCLALACGPSASVSGNVDGFPLVVKSAGFVTVGLQTPAVMIRLADYSGVCGGTAPNGSTALDIFAVPNQTGPDTGAGGFYVQLHRCDASGQSAFSPNTYADGHGPVTLTKASASEEAGTFDLTFVDNGTAMDGGLQGSFDVSHCSGTLATPC